MVQFDISSAFAGAIITAVIGLIGIFIKNKFEAQKIKIQGREKVLNNVIDSRFNAIRQVTDIMVDTFFILNRKLNIYYNSRIPTPEFDETKKLVELFEDTVNKAKVWVKDDVAEALNKVRGSFRLALDCLWRRSTYFNQSSSLGQTMDWENFENSFKNAKMILKEVIGTNDLEKHLESIFE